MQSNRISWLSKIWVRLLIAWVCANVFFDIIKPGYIIVGLILTSILIGISYVVIKVVAKKLIAK